MCLALLGAGCGGGGLSLDEYAQEVESQTTGLYATLDELTIRDRVPTVEEMQTLYRELAAAYHRFHDGLAALEPPTDAADLHEVSLDIISRLATTHDALAERSLTAESVDELMGSAESLAARATEQEIIAFCIAAQHQMDATAEREAFQDVPWIPSELQQVVNVVFGCEDVVRTSN